LKYKTQLETSTKTACPFLKEVYIRKFFKHRKMSIIKEKPNKGKGGRKTIHSDNFKVQIALEYLAGDYSCPQVAKKYNLTEGSVEWFVSWYRKNHQQIMTEEPELPENSCLSSEDVQALQKKLALAEMTIAALEKVIAIANEDYRTDLKKKAATR